MLCEVSPVDGEEFAYRCHKCGRVFRNIKVLPLVATCRGAGPVRGADPVRFKLPGEVSGPEVRKRSPEQIAAWLSVCKTCPLYVDNTCSLTRCCPGKPPTERYFLYQVKYNEGFRCPGEPEQRAAIKAALDSIG